MFAVATEKGVIVKEFDTFEEAWTYREKVWGWSFVIIDKKFPLELGVR